jgi:hypothetical protein
MKVVIALLALLCPLAAGTSATLERDAGGKFEIQRTQGAEGPLLTVRAQDAPAENVLRAIAKELGREIAGLDYVAESDPITVFLEERPANTVIHWIAGSVGWRISVSSKSLLVTDESPPFPTSAELFDVSEIAYLRALRHHPEHEGAASAEMRLAEVQEMRGAWTAAINHYDFLIDKYHDSPLVPEAMLRSGKHLATLGEWEAAAARFAELAQLEISHPYHATGRLELARALCYMGSPQKAIYALDALETHYPSDLSSERRERLLVRGRALALTGEGIDALKALTAAARYSVSGNEDLGVLEVRALALEHANRPGQASVAWMNLGRHAQGDMQRKALANAARLAIEAQDELGALFIHEWAADVGLGKATEPYANQARGQLGLQPENFLTFSPDQRIERGATLFAEGLTAEAMNALEPLYRSRNAIEPAARLQLVLTYARALDLEGLDETAISVLREVAGSLDKELQRKEIYLLAAELHEKHGRLAEAIEALEGRL